ncbi:unnamed protein product [Prorocentrum cordatum]|uniref:Pyridoxine 5'-phosphate oxidase dimerisation C-terminal domain-containing protein n=1 Tax=Prorocentrum cordatum TaxID=2364126 RepID=A0ABN9QYX7_9DINO|nr:unnamed protein product [Polarella glacialis]
MRGAARRGTADETLASWRAQPLGARLGLAMLRQGEPSSEAAYEELRAAFAEQRQLSVDAQPAPACPHAGYSAFVLEPTSFEFYLGGHPGFLNDRFLFVRDDGADAWRRMRLQA